MNNFDIIFGALIMAFFDIKCISIISNKKINYRCLDFYIFLFTLPIVFIFNRFYLPKIFRIVIVLLAIFIINKYLFKEKDVDSIIYSIMLEVIAVVSEILFLIIITVFLKKISIVQMMNIFECTTISNFFIGLIMHLLCNLNIIKKINKKIVIFLHGFKLTNLIVYSIVLFLSLTFIYLLYYQYYNLNNNITITLLLLTSLAYFIIIILSILSDNKYKNTLKKYDMTMDNLKQYEEIINKYKVINHENKNQLLIIRNMINSKESPIEFINELLKDRLNDDEKLMVESSVIPSGGLRAVVYSKLLKIKANGIDYNLEIDKNIRNYNMLEINNSTLMDIYNIVNIFLDNAIEESINNVEKEIFIEMYKEDNIVINISNVIEREINLDLIKKAGYTSKSDGHGYGLSLAEKTINENKYLFNETKIEDDLFIQSLIIKIK